MFVPQNVLNRVVTEEEVKRIETLEEIAKWTALSLGLRLGERSLRSQAMRVTAKHRAQLRKLSAELEELYEKLENGVITLEYFKSEKKRLIRQIEAIREDMKTKSNPFYSRAKEIRNREKVIAFEILPRLLRAAGYTNIAPIEEVSNIPEWARKILDAELSQSQSSKSSKQ